MLLPLLLQATPSAGPDWQTIALGLVSLVLMLLSALATISSRNTEREVGALRTEQKELSDHHRTLHDCFTRLDVAMFGAKGDNGMASEIRGVRQRLHEHINAEHTAKGRRYLDDSSGGGR